MCAGVTACHDAGSGNPAGGPLVDGADGVGSGFAGSGLDGAGFGGAVVVDGGAPGGAGAGAGAAC
jgi:hypothetical protein